MVVDSAGTGFSFSLELVCCLTHLVVAASPTPSLQSSLLVPMVPIHPECGVFLLMMVWNFYKAAMIES